MKNNRMFRLFQMIGLVVLFSPLLGQTIGTIDYQSIQENIEDSNSQYYYTTLLERYNEADTTLTEKDFKHLYYGYTFQDAYKPYELFALDNELSTLIAKGIDSEENLTDLIEVSERYLEIRPVDLKVLNYLSFFTKTTGDLEQHKIVNFKYDHLINTILNSGDGKSIETGYVVNIPTDEHMVMRHLGLDYENSIFETTYDQYKLKENEYDLTDIYFDITRMVKVGTAQMGIETIEVESDEIPENGILIGSVDETKQFIPTGHITFWSEQVDFDFDGDEDWVLITTKDGEENLSDFANGYPTLRAFRVLERKDDGLLKEEFISESIIPCIDCGASEIDPFQSLQFDDKTMVLKTNGGSLFQWERKSVFQFENGEWMLKKEEFSSFRKGKEETKQVDIETDKDFGKITLSEFDFYKMLN